MMFSIILPVFNREHLVERAINSILDQDYKSFELIIVDDCSTDNTVSIISKFSDKRIKIFQLNENSGPAIARNFGIKKSEGSIISFLDSDDYYAREFLKDSHKILNNTSNKIGFMWTGIRFITEDKFSEGIWEPERKKNPYYTFLHDLKIGIGSGITIKREVFEECGLFDERLPAAEDTDFFLRISQKYDYVYSKKVLINIDKSKDDRISKNFKKIAQAYNIFIPEHFEAINKCKRLKFKYYYKLMWLNYNLKDVSRARAYFWRALLSKNLSIKLLLASIIYELLPLRLAKKIHFKLAQ